jgi:hypothetical protein
VCNDGAAKFWRHKKVDALVSVFNNVRITKSLISSTLMNGENRIEDVILISFKDSRINSLTIKKAFESFFLNLNRLQS